jgi:S1-C subfamily serine protease
VAVLERPRYSERILSMVSNEQNLVPQLGILAVDLDEKVAPLLPPLRRLAGVVVAGVVSEVSGQGDEFYAADVIYSVNSTTVRNLAELREALRAAKPGDPVAVQVERLGQLQYLLIEVD